MSDKSDPKLLKGDLDGGNGQCIHIPSEGELTATVAQEMNKRIARLKDNSIDLALRAAESRDFLIWHTNHVQENWLLWLDNTTKVMEDIRQTRVAIGTESNLLLRECAEVRKFFLSDDHEKEIVKLREFVELAERLRALKNDGTLDKLADTILKLA